MEEFLHKKLISFSSVVSQAVSILLYCILYSYCLQHWCFSPSSSSAVNKITNICHMLFVLSSIPQGKNCVFFYFDRTAYRQVGKLYKGLHSSLFKTNTNHEHRYLTTCLFGQCTVYGKHPGELPPSKIFSGFISYLLRWKYFRLICYERSCEYCQILPEVFYNKSTTPSIFHIIFVNQNFCHVNMIKEHFVLFWFVEKNSNIITIII